MEATTTDTSTERDIEVEGFGKVRIRGFNEPVIRMLRIQAGRQLEGEVDYGAATALEKQTLRLLRFAALLVDAGLVSPRLDPEAFNLLLGHRQDVVMALAVEVDRISWPNVKPEGES